MTEPRIPKSKNVFWIEETWLNEIATEHYGRPYHAQQTGSYLANDTVHHYRMNEEEVSQRMSDMESARTGAYGCEGHYLGWDRASAKSCYIPGINWFDYWLSLKWDEDKKSVLILPDRSNMAEYLADQPPAEHEDARGYIFRYDFQVYRMAPTPDLVLADLIHEGVLPYGDYVMSVCW